MQLKIFEQIAEERQSQEEKWGEQNHNSFKWLSILMEEVGEVSKAALEAEHGFSLGYRDAKIAEYRQELIQVAAVAVSMIECLHRNEPKEF